MNDIYSNEIIEGKEELKTIEDIENYNDLSCTLDVDYTAKLENDFHLCLAFYIRIREKDIDVISYEIPYTLIYSLETYEAYSLDELLKSAVYEVGTRAYNQFAMIGTIYFQKKLEVDERRKHNHA